MEVVGQWTQGGGKSSQFCHDQALAIIAARNPACVIYLGTTNDPATPYENGVTVADRLTSGVLLTYEGEGHTITFQGSACVDGIAVPYLIDLTVPADDSRC